MDKTRFSTKVVSLVYSQSEILEQEVYLVEKLDTERSERFTHLNTHMRVSLCAVGK